MDPEPVVVIGAGLAGLTLARTLSKHSIKCVIYEGEAGAHIRGQGGSLDLRPDSGQKALEIAGAYEAWKNVARFDGEDIRILNKNGKILLKHCDNESGYAPEIDRGQLRQLLLEGLENEGSNTTIHWDHQLKEVAKIDKGFLCKFANGNEILAKTLVGADGAWSKVRTSLFKDSSLSPFYTGISFADCNIPPQTTQNDEKIREVVGNGTRFAMGEDKSLIAQRNSGNNIRIYTMLRVPEDWVKTYGEAHPEPSECIQQIINDYYADWTPELIHLVKNVDPESLVLRSIYQMPVGCRWNPIPGVTLIGDAAHLMSPFGGQGANMAMLDAAELGITLATHPCEKWDEAVAEFEKKMQSRAKWAALMTANNLKIFFGKEWIRLVMIYGVGKPLIFFLTLTWRIRKMFQRQPQT